MSNDLVIIAETLANEKQIDIDSVFTALEEGLSVAARRFFENERNFRVEINRKTGEYTVYRSFKVVEEVNHPTREITFEAAQYEEPEIKLGEYIEDLVEDSSFLQLDRITLHTTRQVMIGKIREFEKEQAAQRYEKDVGSIVQATVKKVTPSVVVVDLGDETEAVLYKEHLLSRDRFRVGDKVRALLLEIKRATAQNKSTQIILSRTSPLFLNKLFEIEVPEIADGSITIVNSAREPGFRSKVAVTTPYARIDAVGSCVGMRGARINQVSNEIQQEKIDIVLYDEDLTKYTVNVLAPASINEIFIDEKNHIIEASVNPESLAKTIGRNGQNVRLASQLIGWEIKIIPQDEFTEKRKLENTGPIQTLMTYFNFDEDSASFLVEQGFTKIQDFIGEQAKEDLIDLIDEEQTILIQNAALEAIEKQKNDLLEYLKKKNFDFKLLEFDLINEEIAVALAREGILTIDDLADQSSFDLEEIEEVDKSIWDSLIMQAREISYKQE